MSPGLSHGFATLSLRRASAAYTGSGGHGNTGRGAGAETWGCTSRRDPKLAGWHQLEMLAWGWYHHVSRGSQHAPCWAWDHQDIAAPLLQRDGDAASQHRRQLQQHRLFLGCSPQGTSPFRTTYPTPPLAAIHGCAAGQTQLSLLHTGRRWP